jgi:thymidylate synthase (FAD)
VNVLDKGYIELADCMGSDVTVVNAARVSFAKSVESMSERDEKLLKYLADHGHVSPFYHPMLSFRVKAPISVQRQAFKHKVGTAENSESTRYIEVTDEFYVPDVFRAQSTSSKQGSSGAIDEQAAARRSYEWACRSSFDAYYALVEAGVAKEQAREVLPLCTYTSWYWTLSLAAAIHFIRLRDDEHAQHEIRLYAKAMRVLVAEKFPKSLAAVLGEQTS